MFTQIQNLTKRLNTIAAGIRGGRRTFLGKADSRRHDQLAPGVIMASLRFFLRMQVWSPMLLSGQTYKPVKDDTFRMTHKKACGRMDAIWDGLTDNAARDEADNEDAAVNDPGGYLLPPAPPPPSEEAAGSGARSGRRRQM
eukprot:GHVU01114994.1.p1 GENE.GHVU01114994.1~~GHVU01114994.1.p1  ORF type:complete len:165 (+),score=20.42 GHVU01114994.1:73-495(+)